MRFLLFLCFFKLRLDRFKVRKLFFVSIQQIAIPGHGIQYLHLVLLVREFTGLLLRMDIYQEVAEFL